MWFFQLIFWLFIGYYLAKLFTQFVLWVQRKTDTVSDGIYLGGFILIIVYAVIGALIF